MRKIEFFVLMGTMAVAAFALSLAACASAPSAYTAADLVSALGDKAMANGDTVMLSGNVDVDKDITVPAGVTLDLDLTGAAILLKDGVTLTVNGIVNTRAGGIKIDAAGAATINGRGIIFLKGKGQLFDISEGKKLTLDGVTLAGVADNDSPLVRVGEGGELILKSGAIMGNTNYSNNHYEGTGGGVYVFADPKTGVGATFTMEGGTISGNGANWGGGVSVFEGTFTMKGGTISGNSAEHAGGGVFVDGNPYIGVGATFNMEGGTISGNSAADGGGVAAQQCSFTMEGGIISGNTSTTYRGGGVSLDGDSSFTLKGGRIQGSTDSDGFAQNTSNGSAQGAALTVADSWAHFSSAKWGMGGTYTKGGIPQTGGSDIGSTDETLIAIPAR